MKTRNFGFFLTGLWVGLGCLGLSARASDFVLADLDTGSTLFTNSNEVEVVVFDVPDGYDQWQVIQSTNASDLVEINWEGTNALPVTVEFVVPDPEGIVTNVAWFRDEADTLPLTNLTAVIEYVRASADVTTEAVATLSVPSWGASWPAVVHLDAIEVGSSSAIGVFSRSLSVDPDADETPEEPETITLSGTNVYTVTLTVMDAAGNTATDTTSLSVFAGELDQDTTWTGDVGSDWFDHANWSNYAPGPGATATVNAGAVLLNASTPALAELDLAGGTLTFTGWDTKLTAAEVTVSGTITHPEQSATEADPVSGQWVPDNRVRIECSNLVVTANGILNANAKGYGGGDKWDDGYGPGGGKFVSKGTGWGGTYGGAGGLATTDLRYGEFSSPTNPGSGGGPWQGFVPSHGGGAVQITAYGAVTIDGTITADGGTADRYGAGGSGGAIFITCRTFAGSNGTLSASGKYAVVNTTAGSGGGGGGGGRIALIYDPVAQAAQNLTAKPDVKIVAAEGIGTAYLPSARPGTIYLTDSGFFPTATLWGGVMWIPGFESWTTESLTIRGGLAAFTNGFELSVDRDLVIRDNGGIEMVDGVLRVGGDMRLDNTNPDYALSWLWSASGEGFTVASNLVVNNSHLRWYGARSNVSTVVIGENLVLTNKGHLSVYSGPTNAPGTDFGGLFSVGETILLDGESWIYPYSDPENGGSALFRSKSLVVEPGTGFDAYAKGYAGTAAAGFGPGGGESAGNKQGHGGGGYGGAGGDGAAGYAGGVSYGSKTHPTAPGSAGGAWSSGYEGGNGGGLIRIEVAKKATLNGVLDASGYAIPAYGAGGAGGGIYLTCSTLAGETATLSATGGKGKLATGGGGGGGRIALWRTFDKTSTNDWTLTVSGGEGYTDGVDGTVHWGQLPFAGSVIILR